MRAYEDIEIEGTYNTRDIGGVMNKDDNVLSKRKFIRSASLSGITKKGFETVKNLNVDCIIDIRTKAEMEFDPNSFIGYEGIDYYAIPMKDYYHDIYLNGLNDDFPDTKVKLYIWMIDHNRVAIRKIFKILADEKYRTIIHHCSSGKDRTGIITMLILKLLDVSNELILEDFIYSKERLTKIVNTMEVKRDTNMPEYYFNIDANDLLGLIDYIDNHYKNVLSYLKSIGINESDVQRLRRKLI
ncbi:tyrosine-protein phosphatase [Fusibacter sp. 3D3]|uniref:tyrosine-protein phosphatase n=1 Tax=Fusibacter sp. 3D3 TaxID=1048380 RepID=UPI000853C225|nr:tyrosine-protein phosphatase [Fusibacter sp. 3D3]